LCHPSLCERRCARLSHLQFPLRFKCRLENSVLRFGFILVFWNHWTLEKDRRLKKSVRGMAAAGVGGSEQDQVLLGKLTRARRTVYQMLKDRGYKVPESCLEETRETVEQEFRQNEEKLEKMIILVSRPSDSEDKLLVFFAESSKKVGVLPIRKLTDQMTENNINKAILVVTHPLTPFAKEAINEMKPKHNIETFQMSELMVNITHHELVPKHIPLSKEDKERLLEKYKTDDGGTARRPYVEAQGTSTSFFLRLFPSRLVSLSEGQGVPAAQNAAHGSHRQILQSRERVCGEDHSTF